MRYLAILAALTLTGCFDEFGGGFSTGLAANAKVKLKDPTRIRLDMQVPVGDGYHVQIFRAADAPSVDTSIEDTQPPAPPGTFGTFPPPAPRVDQ